MHLDAVRRSTWIRGNVASSVATPRRAQLAPQMRSDEISHAFNPAALLQSVKQPILNLRQSLAHPLQKLEPLPLDVGAIETAFTQLDAATKRAYLLQTIKRMSHGTLATNDDAIEILLRCMEHASAADQELVLHKICDAFAHGHFTANVSPYPYLETTRYGKPTEYFVQLHYWALCKITTAACDHKQRSLLLVALARALNCIPDESHHAHALHILESMRTLPSADQQKIIATLNLPFIFRNADYRAHAALQIAVRSLRQPYRSAVKRMIAECFLDWTALSRPTAP